MGFAQVGQTKKNINICAAIISSPGRPNAMSKLTNNQLFILHSADGSGQKGILFPHQQQAVDVSCKLEELGISSFLCQLISRF